jgi:hypothetical protein
MFTQTLRNIRNFFSAGKKSIFSSADLENTRRKTSNNTERKVQLLYHRDLNNIQLADSKTETLQHEWWIN